MGYQIFKNNLTEIENRMKNLYSSSSPKYNEDAKSINEFISNLREHFLEEEQIVFPLVLKAECNLHNFKIESII